MSKPRLIEKRAAGDRGLGRIIDQSSQYLWMKNLVVSGQGAVRMVYGLVSASMTKDILGATRPATVVKLVGTPILRGG